VGRVYSRSTSTAPLVAVLEWIYRAVRFAGQPRTPDRQMALNLFDAFGTKEKTLHANMGGHTGVPQFEGYDGSGPPPAHDACVSRPAPLGGRAWRSRAAAWSRTRQPLGSRRGCSARGPRSTTSGDGAPGRSTSALGTRRPQPGRRRVQHATAAQTRPRSPRLRSASRSASGAVAIDGCSRLGVMWCQPAAGQVGDHRERPVHLHARVERVLLALLFLVESLPIIMLLFFASERLLTEGLTAGAEQG
jgi:hypothetical protein